MNWNDLRLFVAVARSGGLAGATAASGVSAPTLGRRMTALEQALGVTLFARHRDGYDLTADGQTLLELTATVEQGAHAVERWRAGFHDAPTVRIAAGPWTSLFIARSLAALTSRADAPPVAVMAAGGTVDLHRREAQIGIRNRRPDSDGLAARRLGPVAFAVYQTPEPVDNSHVGWIALTPPGPPLPSASWLEQRLEGPATVQCSSADCLLAAAKAGAGRCVLPCFIGDVEPDLERATPVIAELTHDQWLVVHDDDRHTKPVRRVVDWLASLIREHRPLFAGNQPQDT
ncbi:MAG: LysR family transcriptional regulator [Pseudomonadota bacterium]